MNLQELKRGSEVLQKYAYGYGQIDTSTGTIAANSNNGQLAKIESTIGANKQWEQRFGYDSIGRLKEGREHRGDTNALSYKQVFDYDRFGNLYQKASSNPTAGQATPIAFAPIEDADISKTTNRFTTNTTYDDAGNVTTDNKFRGLNYFYDANGRMYKTTHTSLPNQSSAVYDASGQRVATQVDGVWTFFIYDIGGKKVAEYGGLQATDEGGVKYVLQDYQGSTRAIVGNNGYVQARMDYTAFGTEIQSNIGQRTAAGYAASSSLNEKYALTERDKATGLDHTWFRKLEQQAGRWTSPDPYRGSMNIGDPQSFNRYSYVENQPTNFVDPSGLQLRSFDISQGMGCVYNEADGKFHCTEYIDRYWYDDGTGNGDGNYDDPIDILSSGFEKYLAKNSGGCEKKLNAALDALGKDFTIKSLAEKFFKGEGGRKIIFTQPNDSRAIGDYDGDGKIKLNPSNPNNPFVFIHELLHAASTRPFGKFTHEQIFEAMANVDGLNFNLIKNEIKAAEKKRTKQERKEKSKNEWMEERFSNRMNNWIGEHCPHD